MPNTSEMEALVQDFVVRLQEAVRSEVNTQISAAITAALSAPSQRRAAMPRASQPPGSPTRRRLNLSAAGMAARKMQGQYLGLLRGLPASQRVRVKKVAQGQGVAAALKFAEKLR